MKKIPRLPAIPGSAIHPAWPKTAAVAELAGYLEASVDAIVAIGDGGRIVDWNPAAEAMLGYSRAIALGRFAAELIAPGILADTRHDEIVRALNTGRGRFVGRRLETTTLRANGARFPIELTLTRTDTRAGFRLTALVRDLTEQRRQDTSLRRSELRFRLLVEGVQDYAIHLLDPRGRILTWNLGAERIEGYRAREIIGRRFHRLYTPDDIARGRPEQALATASAEGRYSEEGWSVRKDDSRYWASVVLTALRQPDGELFGYSRIGRDHTRDRAATLATAQQIAELEAHLHRCTEELDSARRSPPPELP